MALLAALEGEYMTTAEAAVELNVKPKTVSEYIARGLLAAEQSGRMWYIPSGEVARFKNERRTPGRPRKSA